MNSACFQKNLGPIICTIDYIIDCTTPALIACYLCHACSARVGLNSIPVMIDSLELHMLFAKGTFGFAHWWTGCLYSKLDPEFLVGTSFHCSLLLHETIEII